MALSGGSTPQSLYTLLAQNHSLPWDKIYFFFGDERHVPPDSPESNYRMARESLFSKLPNPGHEQCSASLLKSRTRASSRKPTSRP